MKIETFFMEGGKFVDVNHFGGVINDVDYISGSISLHVKGHELIDATWSDYVDQLWSYIVDAANDALSGKSAKFFYPDQPIGILFNPVGGNIEISVDFNGVKKVVVNREEFSKEIRRAGGDFFERMKILVPTHSDTWDDCLKRLPAI
jgi:hypothetical protein